MSVLVSNPHALPPSCLHPLRDVTVYCFVLHTASGLLFLFSRPSFGHRNLGCLWSSRVVSSWVIALALLELLHVCSEDVYNLSC